MESWYERSLQSKTVWEVADLLDIKLRGSDLSEVFTLDLLPAFAGISAQIGA